MDAIDRKSKDLVNRRRLFLGCGLALGGMMLFRPLERAHAESATPETESGPGNYLSINGVDLYVTELGPKAGSPVVMLHGGLGSSENWAFVAPALADAGYRIILLDSRSQGRSGWSEELITYELMASDVIGLLDALNIDRAGVVGWSDGAIVGLELAMNSPERLESLVAYGANFTPDGLSLPSSGPEFDAFVGQLAAEYQRLSPQPERFEELFAQFGALYAVAPNFSEAQLQQIATPVLVLDGAEEEIVKPDQPVRLAALIPGAHLEIMPGTGHFAPLEQPEVFSQIVLGFLSEGSAGSPVA